MITNNKIVWEKLDFTSCSSLLISQRTILKIKFSLSILLTLRKSSWAFWKTWKEMRKSTRHLEKFLRSRSLLKQCLTFCLTFWRNWKKKFLLILCSFQLYYSFYKITILDKEFFEKHPFVIHLKHKKCRKRSVNWVNFSHL